MKRILQIFIFNIIIFIFVTNNANAIENPLVIPNNKMGVHILFTEELNSAANLVNSNNGDWGYVTIPIQAGDRGLEKWQNFMDLAKEKHVIPIIRLATEGDYLDTTVWRKPSKENVLDFANFLNSLEWPVENQYVVVFNEPNRDDEWQGASNAAEYAQILNYAVDIFKSLDSNFFIISAGLDNASENSQYGFMDRMNKEVPGIFSKIDGLGSHSYPNPAFSSAPWEITRKSISSFKFEKDLAYNLSENNLPVFITETGWSANKLSENTIASYFTYAFYSVWSDNSIAAVTPFLLRAGAKPFLQFTLIDENGENNPIFKSIQNLSKIKGRPTVNPNSSAALNPFSDENIPSKTFSKETQHDVLSSEKVKLAVPFLKWVLKIQN